MAELSGQMTPVIIVTAFICFCPNAFSIPVLSNVPLKDIGCRPLPSLPRSCWKTQGLHRPKGLS